MIVAPLLDTHAWVWWMTRDARLRDTVISQLDALPAHERPYLSDVSLWEVAMLVDKRRLELNQPLAEWLTSASHGQVVRVVPVSAAIAAETLTANDLRDPADRLIVATSRVLGAPLFTYDRTILRSRLVERWPA